MRRNSFNRRMRQRRSCRLEIDYDRLANAILKAQLKIDNKKNKHSKVRRGLMNFLNGTVYISISILCFYGIYYVWHSYSGGMSNNIVLKIIITILLGVLGVVLFLSQQESLEETEEESNEHFNTNLSLAALIIALIALFRTPV